MVLMPTILSASFINYPISVGYDRQSSGKTDFLLEAGQSFTWQSAASPSSFLRIELTNTQIFVKNIGDAYNLDAVATGTAGGIVLTMPLQKYAPYTFTAIEPIGTPGFASQTTILHEGLRAFINLDGIAPAQAETVYQVTFGPSIVPLPASGIMFSTLLAFLIGLRKFFNRRSKPSLI